MRPQLDPTSMLMIKTPAANQCSCTGEGGMSSPSFWKVLEPQLLPPAAGQSGDLENAITTASGRTSGAEAAAGFLSCTHVSRIEGE